MKDEEYVRTLYGCLLNREPREGEASHWVGKLSAGLDSRDLVTRILRSKEYLSTHRVRLAYAPGHYYSPVVDPELAERYVRWDSDLPPAGLKGLDYPVEGMTAFWQEHEEILAASAFSKEKTEAARYYGNPIFPIGDAAMLRAIILRAKPARIVEIGSGLSTACMLDTVEEGRLDRTAITCIEPYPDRLYASMRAQDRSRLEIIERPLQEVPVEQFSRLEAGDVLFIDSTHVMKSGSDVNYELFEILPSLPAGVLIHFHDIHYPFEYPREWVLEKNFSWNEIYAVRAFLMYNHAFEIVFQGSYFATRNVELVRRTYEPFLRNPGGSLWIRKSR